MEYNTYTKCKILIKFAYILHTFLLILFYVFLLINIDITSVKQTVHAYLFKRRACLLRARSIVCSRNYILSHEIFFVECIYVFVKKNAKERTTYCEYLTFYRNLYLCLTQNDLNNDSQQS